MQDQLGQFWLGEKHFLALAVMERVQRGAVALPSDRSLREQQGETPDRLSTDSSSNRRHKRLQVLDALLIRLKNNTMEVEKDAKLKKPLTKSYSIKTRT